MISTEELKKQWGTKRLDAESVFITTPKEITECMTIPNEIGGKKVRAIGPGAFSPLKNPSLSNIKRQKLKQLRHIVIPEGIAAVGQEAFWGCEALETVEVPKSAVEWDKWVFGYCGNLRKIQLPDGLEDLPYGIFDDCLKLEELPVSEEQIKKFGYAKMEGSGLLGCMLGMIANGKSDFGPEAYSQVTKYVQKKKERQMMLILSGNDAAIQKVLTLNKKLTLQQLDEYLELAQKNDLINVVTLLIAPDAFDDDEEGATIAGLTIYAPAGSYAENYAKENKISFIEE